MTIFLSDFYVHYFSVTSVTRKGDYSFEINKQTLTVFIYFVVDPFTALREIITSLPGYKRGGKENIPLLSLPLNVYDPDLQ